MSSNTNSIVFEICLGNIDDVVLAAKYEVKRIELNYAINSGGLTPSLAMVKQARQIFPNKIIVVIRYRPGGFTYSSREMALHLQDIAILKPYVNGFAFGCLTESAEIDLENLKRIRAATKGKELAFHRAFDLVSDDDIAMQNLITYGVERVISGGSQKYAVKGWEKLAYLQRQYGQSITILAGGGIKANNIVDLRDKTGINEFHASLLTKKYNRDSSASLSYSGSDEENHYSGLDESQLREMIKEISGLMV